MLCNLIDPPITRRRSRSDLILPPPGQRDSQPASQPANQPDNRTNEQFERTNERTNERFERTTNELVVVRRSVGRCRRWLTVGSG